MIETFGHHLMAEYWGCAHRVLNDVEAIESLMNRAALAARATIVTSVFHQFAPQGVSGVVVVEESHLSIHTWPEEGYAAVDFFTCGDADPTLAHESLLEALGAARWELAEVERGRPQPSDNLRMRVLAGPRETPVAAGRGQDAPRRPWGERLRGSTIERSKAVTR